MCIRDRYQRRVRENKMTKTEFKVDMTCGGCANAVKGVLKKVNGKCSAFPVFVCVETVSFGGIESLEVDWPTKKVVVTGSASKDELLAALQKTGKSVEFISQS
eukprot:TRINITY_DN358_c0_g1_i4.p1 TRINITY_DN358_c0_g1~~TRINITY_DN358_c0_g1_i4.p1  ORF type:complete len:103 (-),score=30.83 TRINITY_DN358_c0_g1_i4:134-442(-)